MLFKSEREGEKKVVTVERRGGQLVRVRKTPKQPQISRQPLVIPNTQPPNAPIESDPIQKLQAAEAEKESALRKVALLEETINKMQFDENARNQEIQDRVIKITTIQAVLQINIEPGLSLPVTIDLELGDLERLRLASQTPSTLLGDSSLNLRSPPMSSGPTLASSTSEIGDDSLVGDNDSNEEFSDKSFITARERPASTHASICDTEDSGRRISGVLDVGRERFSLNVRGSPSPAHQQRHPPCHNMRHANSESHLPSYIHAREMVNRHAYRSHVPISDANRCAVCPPDDDKCPGGWKLF